MTIIAAYEAAVAQGSGGAYLRQESLYSSQITEWRSPQSGTGRSDLPRCRRRGAGSV